MATTDTQLQQLVINVGTQAQIEAAIQSGTITSDMLSVTTDGPDYLPQIATLPTASVSYLGQIYQYTGVTNSTYTNGYFYKCVSDGASTPTYTWTAINVQADGGSSYTAGSGIDITSGVISATSPTVIESGVSSGVTDSHSIFGGTVTDNYSMAIGPGASASDEYDIAIGRYASTGGEYSVALGQGASASSHYTTAVGAGAAASYKSTAVGRSCVASGTYSTAIGWNCSASGNYSIQLGGAQYGATNSVANTIKYANVNGNFEIISADGTIPTDRFTTTPSADGNYVPTLSISSGTATRSWTSIASSVSSSSTNAETVGAKLFYDTVGDIVTLINAL